MEAVSGPMEIGVALEGGTGGGGALNDAAPTSADAAAAERVLDVTVAATLKDRASGGSAFASGGARTDLPPP